MTWLRDEDWAWVRNAVPVAVVDVAALSRDSRRVCLIWRETPSGRGWNLVGGRILKDEPVRVAIERHVHETLGRTATVAVGADPQPDYVAQYFPKSTRTFAHDPRQHAVGLTYALVVTGRTRAIGEALARAWFSVDELPPRRSWGFDQDRVAERCLRRAGLAPHFGR
jgi:ADP-ribose pyrophosphatase YjhB (NUDIX family)